jgi:aminoglycoside 3-N-acetyltransferase
MAEDRRPLGTAAVADQLRALGVKQGGVLLVHSSFRETRPVEGGPRGLLAALRAALGAEGTLVMPSWSGNDDEPFVPAASPASRDLGVVADCFWRLPGVRRSDHVHAFAADGPLAARITGDPLPLPPCIPASPVGRVHELDGQVLLLGVGHDADTTIHLAEHLAGVPYRVPTHFTVLRDGLPARVDSWEHDHCCARFALMDGWLLARGLQSEGRVGHAHGRLARAGDIIAVTLRELARDPLVFLHPPSEGCAECERARASIQACRSRPSGRPRDQWPGDQGSGDQGSGGRRRGRDCHLRRGIAQDAQEIRSQGMDHPDRLEPDDRQVGQADILAQAGRQTAELTPRPGGGQPIDDPGQHGDTP